MTLQKNISLLPLMLSFVTLKIKKGIRADLFMLIEELKELPFNKQVAFAYLTCERLFRNYVYFSENYNFGSPNVLREAIDFLYESIFDNGYDEEKIKSLIKRVEKNTPDTENFSTAFVSSALDACTCILDSLNFLLDKDFLRMQQISSYATDSVDMHIQEIERLDFNNDMDFQHKIDTHPLMEKEKAMQKGIITFLSKSKFIDEDDIQTLLHLQESNEKSNLNL